MDIQNATLAGGVAIGCVANLPMNAGLTLLLGGAAGFASSLGYAFLQPYLCSMYGLHDTCGVNNLHGMPSIIGALWSVVMAAIASEDHTTSFYAWSHQQQAATQLYGILVCVGFAVCTGIITGHILKLFDVPFEKEVPFVDSSWWEIGGDDNDESKEAVDKHNIMAEATSPDHLSISNHGSSHGYGKVGEPTVALSI